MFANEQRLENGGGGAEWGGKKVGITQDEEGGRQRQKIQEKSFSVRPNRTTWSKVMPTSLPGHKWCFSGEFSNSQPNTKLIFLLISLREHLSEADAQYFKKKQGNDMAWKKRKDGMVIWTFPPTTKASNEVSV